MNQELIDRIRQCPSLPSLPTIAMQVLDLAQKTDVDITEIGADHFERSSALHKNPSHGQLQLLWAQPARQHDQPRAGHFGLQSVKTLVLGFSLVTNLKSTKNNRIQAISRTGSEAFTPPTAARTIAAKINVVQQEEAFLAALLKDIGMLVLDQVLGEPLRAKSITRFPRTRI